MPVHALFRTVLAGVKRGNNKTGYDGPYAQLAMTGKDSVSLAEKQKLMQLERELERLSAFVAETNWAE